MTNLCLSWYSQGGLYMQDKMRKRLWIDRDLNERLKRKAKQKGMNSDEYIETAIEFFIEYEEGYISTDNIYTQRINELTQQIDLLRHEFAGWNQSMHSRLDTILEYQGPTNYLNK